MENEVYKHNDCDDSQLSLHDCIAKKITYKDGVLSFFLPDGFWIMPNHEASDFDNTVKTDAARVDFLFNFPDILELEDVRVQVFKRNIFKKEIVEYWDAQKLIDTVNSGKCTFEFVFPYRSYCSQMWDCTLLSDKKPYHRTCQLFIPGTEAIYRWNNLRPDCTW